MKLTIDTENKTVIVEDTEVIICDLWNHIKSMIGDDALEYKLIPKVVTVFTKPEPGPWAPLQPLSPVCPTPWTIPTPYDPTYNPYVVTCTAKGYPATASISNTKSNE